MEHVASAGRADGGLRSVSPAPREVWADAVRADPYSLVYHRPEWVDCVAASGRFEQVTRRYETRDGRNLILPLLRRRLPGAALSLQASMPPGWGTGGLVSAQRIHPEDVAAVCADLRDQPGTLRTFIQPSPLTASAWAGATGPGIKTVSRLSHVLDLSGGYDAVWSARFTGSARTAVRKAEKLGVVVHRDTTGKLLPVFYALLRRSVERWAEQQHEPLPLARWRWGRRDPLTKFESIAAALPDAFRLYLAEHEGRFIAGILIYHGACAMYSRGAMDKDKAGPTRANYLLHRVAIEDACEAGCRFYDFGESGASAQLAQFKTRFGAVPAPYREYIIERLPLTEADRALRGAVKRVIGFRDTVPAGPAPGSPQSERAAS